MSWSYRHLVRPLLFRHDAESIHDFTLGWLGRVAGSSLACAAVESVLGARELAVEAFGLRFPNPVGLAAGMDKEGRAVPAWAALGFGFSELGGVTWLAQPGNPKPRVFRAIAESAIVNRMGFNNDGAEAVAERLAAWQRAGRWPSHPVGVNLGKSKATPLDRAAEDYVATFRAVWPYADFFVVNVSSPNTPNLRQLQDKRALDEILAALQEANRALADVASDRTGPRGPKPILVKVAPDLSLAALDDILDLAGPRRLAGCVATNTTLSRPDTANPDSRRVYAETGGLSGRPLRVRSTEVIRHLYRQTRGQLPIVGVGGIFSAEDAWEKIAAGATLVQVYTGLVFEGPALARRIVRGLATRLKSRGWMGIAQAVGCEASGCTPANAG